MEVSGEFKYFGPDFSSAASVRPVNAITFPASLAIGNITRLRNLEYMAEVVGPFAPLRAGSKRSLVVGLSTNDSLGSSGAPTLLSSRAEAGRSPSSGPPESRDLGFC